MSIDTLLTWLAGNPYLNLLFLLLAIASVLVSIFLYFKSKKSKEPKYLTKSFSIIDDSISAIDELDIKYKNLEIQRLTISKLSFWNGGHETIEGNDIAPADKLRISLRDKGEIISVKPILEKREAINVDCNIFENEINITFDFLDYGDGAIFEIYHTGSSNLPLKLIGTIKGASKISYGEYKKDQLLEKFLDPVFSQFKKLNFKRGSIPEKIILAFLVPIAVPLIFIISPIDAIASYFFRVPKDYDLSTIDTSGKKLHKTNNT